jgi:hypothetical protein
MRLIQMIRTQVQFTEEQIEGLRTRAVRDEVSVAELVRRAVDALMASEASPGQARKRAHAVAGQFRSGRRDIAQRHDDHLAAAFDE